MEEYVFDKRKIKKFAKRYALYFLIAIPFMVISSLLTIDKLPNWASILITSIVCIIILCVCTLVHNARQIKKEEQQASSTIIISNKKDKKK